MFSQSPKWLSNCSLGRSILGPVEPRRWVTRLWPSAQAGTLRRGDCAAAERADGHTGERWRHCSWALTALQLGTLWSNSSISPGNVCTKLSTRHSLGTEDPRCPGEDRLVPHSTQLPTGPLNGVSNTSPSRLGTSKTLAGDSCNDLALWWCSTYAVRSWLCPTWSCSCLACLKLN